MGIFIPDMNVPKRCVDCFLVSKCEACKKFWNPSMSREDIVYISSFKSEDCPLIEAELNDLSIKKTTN